MHEFPYLGHIGSLENGIDLINKLYWNITIEEGNSNWAIKAGEKVIFWADSRESIDAFLYGMALAYSVLSEDLIKQHQDALDL